DHVEETVMPAETLGKHYFVPVPTGPHQTTYGHVVRIYGNIDGTQLTYPSGIRPASAPSTINAGQVVDLGIVSQSFEVQGAHVLESDHYFGIQVIGYGLQTSYQSPGGLNLEVIAAPPPPPR